MTREYTVLRALHGAGLPVPEPLLLCGDESVVGAPFFVMSAVDGLVLRTTEDASVLNAEQAAAASRHLVGTLARIHAVDVAAVGLEGFGRPGGFLERQVRRWRRQWESSAVQPVDEMDELSHRLSRAIPPSPLPGVVHGDYRFDNTMLDASDPSRIAAVLDWEMATVGDPLTDLGLLMVYWTNFDEPRPLRFVTTMSHPGFLRRDEIPAVYVRAGGRDAEFLDFYIVLGFYKLAVILETIVARFRQGKAIGEEDFSLAELDVRTLAEMALEVASASPLRGLRG